MHARIVLFRIALSAALVAAASCAKPVDRWASAMAGHAAGSSNEHPREIAPSDLRDCNGDLLDGRETDVSTSQAHCGACGAACAGTCEAGRCKAPVPASTPSLSALDWRAATKPLSHAGPTDVPVGTHGEVSLLAFDFDTDPVEMWRYDACVREGACAPRERPQPGGDLANTPAVGMRWKAAETFCELRGMKVQTPPQDRAMRDAGAAPLGADRFDPVLAAELVTAGFRCTRVVSSP